MCGRSVEETYQFCPYCGENMDSHSSKQNVGMKDSYKQNRSNVTLLVIFLLVAFFPLGILLMWLEQIFTLKTRLVITFAFLVTILIGFAMIIFWTTMPGYMY
jgi:uncharacterized membrane protein YvbJ